MNRSEYPVVVIGAGPVGLAAAAHVLARNLEPLVLERGNQVGASMTAWGHVRLFSPWRYAVDKAAVALLEAQGWTTPDPEGYPTGADLVREYLQPLAATPEMRSRIRLETEVIAVTRDGFDKMKTPGRELAPFLVSVRDAEGREEAILARAVIDASGTWTHPNPLGGSGRYAAGERELADRIAYGIPDVLGTARPRYVGKRVLVVGSGHSAFNVLLDLVDLADEDADADAGQHTTITWAIRRPGERVDNLFGGGINDALPARGALSERVHRLVEAGRLRLIAGLRITGIERTGEGVVVRGPDNVLAPVDEIIAVTGFRPDLDVLSELRLALDSAVESPVALAPLIDPNLHSCGSVPPHGAEELRHPDPDVYIVGMKSYGRAPTFLMLTGYEQVRSVAAAIAGDWEAARDVQLVLPETGVCSTRVLSDRGVACCGPAADAAGDRESSCCRGVEPVTTASGGCCESAAPKVIQLTVAARGSCC